MIGPAAAGTMIAIDEVAPNLIGWFQEVDMITRRRSGFTLVELLVVILIILALSGVLFKISSLVGQKGARMKAAGQLQALHNALAEFYSEYGAYPPSPGSPGSYSTSTDYEYELASGQPAAFRNLLATWNDPHDPHFIGDMIRRSGMGSTDRDFSIGYRYGLASYLYHRDRDGNPLDGHDYPDDGDDRQYRQKQPHWFESDTRRDIDAKSGWQHLLEQVTLDVDHRGHTIDVGGGSDQHYTNEVLRLEDPWGRSYQYLCKPPHTDYMLWSLGPDGSDGTPDDVGRDSYAQ